MSSKRENQAVSRLAAAIRWEEEVLARVRRSTGTDFGTTMRDANAISDARKARYKAEDAVVKARGYLREEDAKYKIVRMFGPFAENGKRTIKRGLTLAQAQAHCKSPSTSSRTALDAKSVRYTKTHGAWFDGYEIDKGR